MRGSMWMKEADKQVGFHEGPNNKNPYGAHYGIPNQPWCALFVSWCCQASGHPLPSMQPGLTDGYASVWYGMQWAKANHFWRPSWEAEPGDAIVYGWAGPGSPPSDMHTGLIVSSGRKGATGHTIEGNRGDQVERQTFVVGSSVVLGTIALTKVLAKRGPVHARPDPQPRHAGHPGNSGPGRIDLTSGTTKELAGVVARLEKRDGPLPHHGNEEELLTAAQEAISIVLAMKQKAHA